jgi:hypothetical protein
LEKTHCQARADSGFFLFGGKRYPKRRPSAELGTAVEVESGDADLR